MRQVTDHIVEGDSANHQLTVNVLDEPGQGGACHEYEITTDNVPPGDGDWRMSPVRISFQNGPIREAGINGVTHEALLAILIDRMRSFQAGPFACAANAHALSRMEEALLELQSRTRERIARGVEGTHTK